MNRTGGRLKRHSKANANQLIKAQKQYFAKARQNLQNGSVPTPPSSFSVLGGHPAFDNHHDLTHAPNRSTRHIKPVHKRPRPLHAPNNRSNIRPGSISTTQDPKRTKSQANPKRDLPPNIKPDAKPNSLESIKRKLLKKSDWTGLAITQPVSINFTPAEEMERIGRRRKVSKQERKLKQRSFAQPTLHHNIIRPFRHRDSQSVAPVPQATDLSIRIGSNIHQTLTTQPSIQVREDSASPQPTPAESMLLEKFEQGQLDRSGLYLASKARAGHDTENDNLISLQEARNLKSFDEVLERSSSVARQPLPSSTPSGDEWNVRQEPAEVTQLWPLSTASTSQNMLDDEVSPSPEAMSKSIKSKAPVDIETNDHGSHAKYHDQSASILVTSPHDVVSGAEQLQSIRHASVSGGIELGNPETRSRPPKFTLDHQVALEREMCDVGRHAAADTDERGTDPRLNEPWKSSLRSMCPSRRSSASQTYDPPKRNGPDVSHLILPESALDFEPRGMSAGNQLPVSQAAQGLPSGRQPSTHHITWRERFQFAKEQHQESIRQGSGGVDILTRLQSGCLGDENEAWMRFVFPKDFERIQTDFIFGTADLEKLRPRASTPSSWNHEPRSWSSSRRSPTGSQSNLGGGISAPTAINTTVFDTSWVETDQNCNPLARPETDFLSRFSPMEGVLDDRLGDVSIYNNAAASEKSFLPLPRSNIETSFHRQSLQTPTKQTIPTKRTAAYAFEESQPLAQSEDRHLSRTRQALYPMAQPRWSSTDELRGRPQDSSHRTPLHGTRPTIVEDTGMKSSGSGNRGDRHRQAVFPMSYTPASSQKSSSSRYSTIGS